MADIKSRRERQKTKHKIRSTQDKNNQQHSIVIYVVFNGFGEAGDNHNKLCGFFFYFSLLMILGKLKANN